MSSVFTQRRAEIEEICRSFHVLRLELFGSAAAGYDCPGESDLDFLVEFEPLPPGGYADSYFGLRESLEALSGRAVDLIVPSAIRNPYFRRLEAKKYLYDIRQSASRIAEFTSGKPLEDYRCGAMLRSAVERQFEIIGEALAQLAKLDQSLLERISEHRRIIVFRNILIHG